MGNTLHFTMRMTEQERANLQHDAHLHEMTASQYIRCLIKRERESIEKEEEYLTAPNKYIDDLYMRIKHNDFN